jgi:hypothetical protein
MKKCLLTICSSLLLIAGMARASAKEVWFAPPDNLDRGARTFNHDFPRLFESPPAWDGKTAHLRIIDNAIDGVPNARAGIRLKNVDAAAVHRDVIAPAASTTTARGISLAVSPNGTTNSTLTNNNVTAITNNPPIICALGQENVVNGNAGAPDRARWANLAVGKCCFRSW